MLCGKCNVNILDVASVVTTFSLPSSPVLYSWLLPVGFYWLTGICSREHSHLRPWFVFFFFLIARLACFSLLIICVDQDGAEKQRLSNDVTFFSFDIHCIGFRYPLSIGKSVLFSIQWTLAKFGANCRPLLQNKHSSKGFHAHVYHPSLYTNTFWSFCSTKVF